METIKELQVQPIDMVCVNLYPFFEKVQAGLTFPETIEFIDIGGPTMLRSAAKNFQDVLVLTDPADYPQVIDGLKNNTISFDLRRKLAGKVFNLTSAYDAAVSRFMLNELPTETNENGEVTFTSEFPQYYTMPLVKKMSLRYGENGHQKAALYVTADKKGAFGAMEQLQGKELSYNNIRDLDVAWKAVCAFNTHVKNAQSVQGVDVEGNPITATFGDAASSVFTIALKHNTPCGAALGKTVFESYKKTYDCDPVSIFGGIIGCSHIIDKEAAEDKPPYDVHPT